MFFGQMVWILVFYFIFVVFVWYVLDVVFMWWFVVGLDCIVGFVDLGLVEFVDGSYVGYIVVVWGEQWIDVDGFFWIVEICGQDWYVGYLGDFQEVGFLVFYCFVGVFGGDGELYFFVVVQQVYCLVYCVLW